MTGELLPTPAEYEQSLAYDPTAPLRASGNLRRRHLLSRIAEALTVAAAVAAVAVLGIVVYTVISRGAGAISFDFLIKGEPEGIGPAIVGTAVIVAIGTVIAAPLGVLIALFTTEYGDGRTSAAVRAATRSDERPALDHHRPLHLRPARGRQGSVGVGGRSRAGDHHAAARGPR